MERDGDIARADLDPEFNVDPYAINSRDTIRADVDMIIMGVKRAMYASHHDGRATEDTLYEEVVDQSARERKRNVLIVVSYEGDLDLMDPHNWPVPRRLAYTTLIPLIGALALFSSSMDLPALTETTQVFRTTFDVQTLPSGMFP